jgi:hypothetical protein
MKHAFLAVAVTLATLTGTAVPQSNSPSNVPPPHSGVAAGQNSPQSGSPPPPARNATNPVVSQPGNSELKTFTGVVSDSFCTRHHYMLSGATPAECTRYCIAHRATYVLLVGDKIYSLENPPGHILDALAGKTAQVTGALVGDSIEIKSVQAPQ